MKENIFKSLRKKNNLTQAELAQKLRIKQSSISRWEQGLTIPDISILTQLADLYDVSLDYLLGRDEKKYSFNTDEEYCIFQRGGGKVSISKDKQELLNKIIDSFVDN